MSVTGVVLKNNRMEYHLLACFYHFMTRHKSLKTERCTACNLDLIKKSTDFVTDITCETTTLHSKKTDVLVM